MSSRIDFVLGKSVTPDDTFIPEIKLPSEENVLRAFLAEYRDLLDKTPPTQRKSIKKTSADKVIKKIKNIYSKACIPTLSDNGIRYQIYKLHEEYQKLNKTPAKNRCKASVQSKVQHFFNKIQKSTLPCWDPEAKLLEEDEEFLENMKTTRTFTLGSLDVVRLKRQQRKKERERRQEEYAKRSQELSTQSVPSISNDNDSESVSENEADTNIKDYEEPSEPLAKKQRRLHRKSKEGTHIFIPKDIISNASLAGFESRTNSSVTHTIGFLGTLIENCGGDKSKVNLSYTHAYRCRVSAVERYAEEVKEGWMCSKPAALHWDGKIMSDIKDKYKKDDRLPILVSDKDSVKLLGVPALPTKSSELSGELISSQVVPLLEKWNCKEQICSMVFDTTSANTGHLTAGCISIQQKLGKALLWSACRKHVGEVMINQVWDDLGVEVSKSPDYLIFKRFREYGFDGSAYACSESRSLVTQDPSSLGDFAVRQARTGKELIRKIKEAKAYDRGDYKECLDLMEAYMGNNDQITFMRPGAVHKARWMGKQLYCFKMVLLSESMPQGVVSRVQLAKLKRIVNFCTFIYKI